MEQSTKVDSIANTDDIPYISAKANKPQDHKEEPQILLSDILALTDKFPLPLTSPLRSVLQRSAMPACPTCIRPSPYKCTACDQPYCSVDCYRKHNDGACSEQFNKDQVMNALKGKKSSSDVRRKTMETLLLHRELTENEASLDPEEAERLLKGKFDLK